MKQIFPDFACVVCVFSRFMDRYEEAAETFRKAALLDPKNSSALHFQAESLLALGMNLAK